MSSSSATVSTEPLPPRRVTGYIRLSRENDETSSPAKQRDIIERYCAARALGQPGHWELVGVESDIDVSASKIPLDDRKGLRKVREAVARGETDAVVVWRLDRLARSVLDYGVLLKEGLDVVSCTESLDTTTPMGRSMVQILLVFAELESATIGERLRATIAYRVSQGDRWRGGAVPYGYKLVKHPSGDGKTLAIEHTEAAFVRQAADIVLGGGSLYRAMTTIRDAGSKPHRAAEWSLSALRAVLTGDSILGRQTRHGSVLRDDSGVIATPWPAVLPVADVERLRAALRPVPITEARRKASRMLSGLLVCESCGQRLRVNSRGKAGARIEAYGCRANADGKRCQRPASINADGLEAYVVDRLLELAGDRPVIERREVIRDAPELAGLEEAIAHTTDAMREPGADLVALAATLGDLVDRRDVAMQAPDEPIVEEVATGKTYRDLWNEAESVEDRRSMVAAAIEGPIVVRPVGRGYRLPASERATVPWLWPTPNEHADRADDGPLDGNSSGVRIPREEFRAPSARLDATPEG